MRKRKMMGVLCTAMLAAALASFALAGSAAAKLTGEFKKFEFCPYTKVGVYKCINSVTTSGEVVLGNKKVPIEKPVTLQGGYGEPVERVSKFFEATNGISLSKAQQNVPGGLAGIVPEASSPPLVKALIKFFFENKLTGVSSTLELAKPATEIRVSELNLIEEEGSALKIPVKVHLENLFLGKSCFVGSSTSPITWELTTGTTKPLSPNKPITGGGGSIEFFEGGEILQLTGTSLVDNAWSAPTASGCGGILSFLVTPIINAQLGSTTAGHNTAILVNTLTESPAESVKENNAKNP